MVETNNYQMAIDMLRCHLGLSEDEAKQQLGLALGQSAQNHATEMQQAMLGLNEEQ